MPNLLSFSWEKDRDGYEIFEFDPTGIEWSLVAGKTDIYEYQMIPKAPPDASPTTLKLLQQHREWFAPSPDPHSDELRYLEQPPYFVLVPVGEESIRYRPLDEYPAIFMELAETPKNPEGVKSFLDKFGPLIESSDPELPEAMYYQIEDMKRAVRAWEASKKAGSLRKWIKDFNRRDIWERSRAGVTIQLTNTDDPLCPNLEIVPNSLISAIWLQFAQQVASSTGLRQCNWCSTWFVFGTGTGRRKSAHYCSDRCRQANHRQGKEKAK